jgi:uncharacterized protein with GYD domain
MIRLVTRGRFTQDYVKGMLAAPEDREPVVRKLVEAVGGKVISFYVTTGDADFLLISETNESEAIIASLMAAASTGTRFRTSAHQGLGPALNSKRSWKGLLKWRASTGLRANADRAKPIGRGDRPIGLVDLSPSPQLPVALARPGWEALSSSL